MDRWGSLGVEVTALTCYHIAQRSTPNSGGPAALFAFVYGTASLVMFAAMVVSGPSVGFRQAKVYASHWASWLLVAAVVGIEIGFYAMYRAGWNISSASISTQSIVAATLVIFGLFVFGEHLTLARSVGLVMCVVGAALVTS